MLEPSSQDPLPFMAIFSWVIFPTFELKQDNPKLASQPQDCIGIWIKDLPKSFNLICCQLYKYETHEILVAPKVISFWKTPIPHWYPWTHHPPKCLLKRSSCSGGGSGTAAAWNFSCKPKKLGKAEIPWWSWMINRYEHDIWTYLICTFQNSIYYVYI